MSHMSPMFDATYELETGKILGESKPRDEGNSWEHLGRSGWLILSGRISFVRRNAPDGQRRRLACGQGRGGRP